MKNRICAMCGKEYTPTKGNQKYCSLDCKYKAMQERQNGYSKDRWAKLKSVVCSREDCASYCTKFRNNCCSLAYAYESDCAFFKTAERAEKDRKKYKYKIIGKGGY